MAVVLHSFCFGGFLKKKEISTAESWLAHMREYEELTGGVITASPGQSSPPLNSSLNVYWLPLTRVCALICVCVCVRVLRWMYALRRGLNSLLIFFLFSCLFYLIFYGFWKCTPVKKVVHVCMCEKLWCVCVCASEPVLWSCSSVCLPLVLQFSISSYRLTPPCRGTTHTHKKKKNKTRKRSRGPDVCRQQKSRDRELWCLWYLKISMSSFYMACLFLLFQ